MKRRPCQYCTAPLEWWARLLHVYTCDWCAYRMAHGGQPLKPPAPEPPPQPCNRKRTGDRAGLG